MKKGENKNYRFVPFLPGAEKKMQKKKTKKLKNTIMASFQAKIVWKRPRKRGNRNYYGSISSQNRLKEDEKGRK